jgi:hypothetical protein
MGRLFFSPLRPAQIRPSSAGERLCDSSSFEVESSKTGPAAPEDTGRRRCYFSTDAIFAEVGGVIRR